MKNELVKIKDDEIIQRRVIRALRRRDRRDYLKMCALCKKLEATRI